MDQPQFTNQDLALIQSRAKDTGLLMDLVPVNQSFVDNNNIIDKINMNKININGDWLKLSILASIISQTENISNISTLKLIEGHFEPYPYQIRVALNVLKEKSSIALLADEVGLGKTIEVGLIMKEHIIRGNVSSVLIVVPKALVTQWQDELRFKFNEEFVQPDDEEFSYKSNKIIISYNKFSRNSQKLTNKQWDLVVVDEAHMLINAASKRRQAIAEIDRRYMLLCTATPLCNKLTDLYSIVDLLYPGLLGTEKEFKKQYFEDRTGRICKENMKDNLKKITSKVMVRTLRKDSGIPFPKRTVYSLRIDGTEEEYDLFKDSIEFIKGLVINTNGVYSKINMDMYGNKRKYILLKEIIALQQSLSSSTKAFTRSLNNRKEKHPEEEVQIDILISKINKVSNYSKVRTLIETLSGIPDSQAVIFTLRLETAYMLSDILNENFMSTRVYEGRLSGHQRQNLINDFRAGKVKYIVATDSAAEGLNLQVANIVINYDLHWNPMKLEQRIGRVHRRGQEKDVIIFNLVIKDTIDDYVIKVLYEKINLFNMTVGGIEAVLSEVEEKKGIEETIMEILLTSKDNTNIEEELDKLKENFNYNKEQNALREEFSKLVLD